jgi:uncharacterized surface protein with fasciclin (FAS1) repeats
MKKAGKILSVLLVAFIMVGVLAPVTMAKGPKDRTTIVDIVLDDDGEFDVLQAAVVRAGLVDALSGRRQYTVFAPTDRAFIDTFGVADEAAAILAVESLDLDDLTDILLFHVSSGRRISSSVLGAPRYKMLNGEFLTRDILSDAGIEATDIKVDNGIIHVINGVLLPE